MLWKRRDQGNSVKGAFPDRCSCSVSIEGDGEGKVSVISVTRSWLDILVGFAITNFVEKHEQTIDFT